MAQPASAQQNFLTGVSAEYIAHLYGRYLANPGNVDPSWFEFFKALNDNEVALLQDLSGASWTPAENRKAARRFDHMGPGAHIVDSDEARPAPAARAGGAGTHEDARQAALDSIRALMLIRAYRARGHML